jgi:prepilin-type N-terminal cleavage/methylation domain-containing protein
MFNKKLQKGFTLIEMLVAMTIFVIFMGVVIQSYLGIVTSQREANEYRVMYSEARAIFDKFSDEIRNGVISYDQMGAKNGIPLPDPVTRLVLFSPDQTRGVIFQYRDEKIGFLEFEREGGALKTMEKFANQFQLKESYLLNSDRIKVEDLNIYISPKDDPYRPENVVNNSLQYQPKVTLFAKFSKEISPGRPPLELNLQTTISSRSYVPGYVAPYLRNVVEVGGQLQLSDAIFADLEGEEDLFNQEENNEE